ncbi:MAG: DUF4173 domain-containing protein [Gemmatimonadaceae bacterium]|nr:DUF4173 domain-containing protein [Gemmatimonadaceae bacterium]
MTPAFASPREGSPSELAGQPALDPDELQAYVAPTARAILLHALLVGVAADLLLRDGFTGLGFPLWLAILALNALSLVWRDGRQVPRETAAWLGLAILWGGSMAWRGSGSLQLLDFVATLFCLGMAAVSLGDPRTALLAERMRDTIWAGGRVIRSVIVGVLPLAFRDAALPAAFSPLRGRFHPALRATLIALPLVLVFGALLRGADPIFASVVALPDFDLGTLLSHVVVIGFFAWVTAGWARSAILTGPPAPRLPEQLPFSLGALDVSVALGALNVLFAAYVLTQMGWFFGGERFLQSQTGLTAAQYARQGFFQMVWVVLLVVPVLLATRAALRPEPALTRRHTALALPLLALLGVMIVSAVLRLRLYVQYYGLTLDRFYPLVFMGWLAIVLAWLALTVLRGRGRPFAAGAVASGLAILLMLDVVVPDVIVARVNVARAAAPANGSVGLDLAHLASLGAEAIPITVAAVLAAAPTAIVADVDSSAELARCRAARRLLTQWGPTSRAQLASADEWRRWNRGEAMAVRTVGENAAALRVVQHEACGRVRAARVARLEPRAIGTGGR